jgi:hypothetical protein
MLMLGYMTILLWMQAVQWCHKFWKGHVEQKGGSTGLYCLDLVWMTQSTSQVLKILPDLKRVWTALVEAWGYEAAPEVYHYSSYSLLVFCGSPQLAQEIHHQKISNDLITAIMGHKHHQMEFVPKVMEGHLRRRLQRPSCPTNL